jgi:hypothetical protein
MFADKMMVALTFRPINGGMEISKYVSSTSCPSFVLTLAPPPADAENNPFHTTLSSEYSIENEMVSTAFGHIVLSAAELFCIANLTRVTASPNGVDASWYVLAG